MRIHPITGMTLEDGYGALADDLQAERIHIPYIRKSQGDAAADAMLAKLKAAEAPPAVGAVIVPLKPALAAEAPAAAPAPAQEPPHGDAGK